MEEKVLNLKEIIIIIKKRYKILLISTILVAIAGFFLTTKLEPNYTASLKIFVGKNGLEGNYTPEELLTYKENIALYSEVIRTDNFFRDAVKDSGVDRDYNLVSTNLIITPFGTSAPILQISYVDMEEEAAKKILKSVSSLFIKTNEKLIVDTDMEVIEETKIMANYPDKNKIRIVSVIVGLVLGIGIILIWDYLDDTVKSAEEMESLLGISVIGSIPQSEKIE